MMSKVIITLTGRQADHVLLAVEEAIASLGQIAVTRLARDEPVDGLAMTTIRYTEVQEVILEAIKDSQDAQEA